MGLEVAARISDLNILWPLGTDLRQYGDDHLRYLKIAVKTLLTQLGEQDYASVAMDAGLGTAFTPAALESGSKLLDTFGAAATQTLITIVGTNCFLGHMVLLRPKNTAHVITVQGTTPIAANNQIALSDNDNFVMGDAESWILLQYTNNGTYSYWQEVLRYPTERMRLIAPVTVPNKPAAGAVLFGIATSDGLEPLKVLASGFYDRVDNGWQTQADAVLAMTYATPRKNACTPTVTRVWTLPTTTVGEGWEVIIHNKAAQGKVLRIQASGGTDVCTVDGQETVRLEALQNTPTSSGHWRLDSRAGGQPGDIKGTARSYAPPGWLLCDGSAILRADYATLFAAISTTFGVGDGSTTFNLPDLRGRVEIGAGTGAGLTARALAAVGGEEYHQLTTAELAQHTHQESFADSVSGAQTPAQISTDTTGTVVQTIVGAASPKAGNVANLNTQTAGGSNSHNTMQPFQVINKCIKI